MLIIHDLESFEAPWQESILTLGVFDGMHRGHQAILQRMQRRLSSSVGRSSVARVLVTYHPHPDLVLGKVKGLESQRQELFTYDEKLALFQRYDLDAVLFLPFSMELAKMEALTYLQEILLGKLRARRIVIGYDQSFGRDRAGDFAFLEHHSEELGYAVEQIRAVRVQREIASSSAIRTAVRQGDIAWANELLGHPFFLTGTVVRGDQIGRNIGFPTANIEVAPSKVLPQNGVYLGYGQWGGEVWRAMVNLGERPTIKRQLDFRFEAHLLDFNRQIYGSQLRIHLISRLRDEEKFAGLDALRDQLERDRAAAAVLPVADSDSLIL